MFIFLFGEYLLLAKPSSLTFQQYVFSETGCHHYKARALPFPRLIDSFILPSYAHEPYSPYHLLVIVKHYNIYMCTQKHSHAHTYILTLV